MEEWLDSPKVVAKRLRPLPSMNFNSLKCLPADTILANFELTVTIVIVVIRFFRFCGRTAPISASQSLLRLVDLDRGSGGLPKASGEVSLSRLVGTVPEDLVMPPIVQETTPAGGRRSRWRRDWARGSATRRTAPGATSTTRPSRRAQDRLRTQTSRPSCATKYWTIPTTGRIASTTWIRRRSDCAQVGAANLMMTASLPTSRGFRRG